MIVDVIVLTFTCADSTHELLFLEVLNNNKDACQQIDSSVKKAVKKCIKVGEK